jgi:hypothetical protein
MKQLTVNHLFYFLLLIILILFLSSCKEESNPVDNNSVFSSTTKTITTATGGTLEITDKNANRIKLIIPPLAVRDTTKITLEILNSVKPNPFSQNILSTIRILPDGLRLDSTSIIKISFAAEISDTNKTTIYFLKKSDLAYVLKTKWIDNKTVEAQISHFSNYGGANPTKQEIESQATNVGNDFNYNIWDWQGFFQYVQTMLKYIEYCLLYGDDELTEQLITNLENKIVNQCNAFLNEPIPDEPCGYYLKALMKYHEAFCLMVRHNPQLEDRFNDRINEVLNRCYVRGELEFMYDYCASAEGAEICRTITGFIPFTVNTTVEPHGQINGSGDLDWNGTMTGLPPNCFYNEVGTVNVTLGGNMVVDEYNVLWMDFEIHEHAYGTVTAGCTGVPPQVTPFNPPDVTHQIRILAQEGSELIMPIPGASSGHFKWILHITFSR